MKRNSAIAGTLLILCGIISVIMLFYFYKRENNKILLPNTKRYVGAVEGPKVGTLKFLNIISNERPDCIDNGFYLYFEGENSKDFIIVTDSIRASFGDISRSLVGIKFRFDRIMKCKSTIENRETFLIMSPPVMLEMPDE